MSKITSISYKILSKVLEKDGFSLSRQKGDHLIYVKKGIIRPIVIPMYENLPIFVIKNNLRTAGINRKKYFEILRRTKK
ncbi:type II toxin-antitoxin system HicA family toxin [Candidatus Peregrinibacteria bacterium]|nr:type II toxin-antitoxin system HicA family toxin [Candidatus Peregrinibacteria bacterium]